MNILEFLKERKQILKVSAIALVGAATVYMIPAHMSSAMVNGGDDGKPIESSQVSTTDSKDDVEEALQSPEEATKEKTVSQTESKVGAKAIQANKNETDAKTVSDTNCKDESEAIGFEVETKREVCILGKGKLCCEITDNDSDWVLSVKDENDTLKESCVFNVNGKFDIDVFFSLAAKKFDETSESFSVIDFANAIPDLNVKKIYVSEKGGLKINRIWKGVWTLSLERKDHTGKEYCKFNTIENFDVGRFFRGAINEFLRSSESFSVIDFAKSNLNLSLNVVCVYGKGGLKIYNNCGIFFLVLGDKDCTEKEYCGFTTVEGFSIDRFFRSAVDEFLKLGESFSVIDFVNSNPNLTRVHDTKEREIKVSLKLLECLPKRGEKGFEKFLELSDGIMPVDKDNEFYKEIKQLVDEITGKVDVNDPQTQIKVAEAIYCWVANNIRYDEMSRQDAISVFKKRKGVCEGYSELINFMMRVADIPSVEIVTPTIMDISTHAYNAIYIDGEGTRGGWILLDSTWASTCQNLIKYFPAGYDYDMSFEESNKKILSMSCHSINIIRTGGLHSGALDLWKGEKGERYSVFGCEKNVKIRVTGDVENVEISRDVLDCGLPIIVGTDIRSLILQGDEEIDISKVYDLVSIDTTRSSRYIAEDGVLYEKDAAGNKGAQIVVFNKEIDKGEYKYFIKPRNTILICGNRSIPLEKFRIPQELFDQYNVEIGPGIMSIVLEGKQELSCCQVRAKDLKDIYRSVSGEYIRTGDIIHGICGKG